MPLTQMNTRIDEELKAHGDAVFARSGISPSQAVRLLWTYAAERQEPPEFMRGASAETSSEQERKLELARDSAGLAWKIAHDICGYQGSELDALPFDLTSNLSIRDYAAASKAQAYLDETERAAANVAEGAAADEAEEASHA